MATSTEKRWRPSPFLDRQLDLAMRTLFDQVYTLDDNTVQGVTKGIRVTSGVELVTGSKKGIATGLTTVSNVQVSLRSATALNEWVTFDIRTGGVLDLYVWRPTGVADTTPIASTTQRTVHWSCVGVI